MAGDGTLPPLRLFLVWRPVGTDDPTPALRQPAYDIPAPEAGAETCATVRLGIPVERTGPLDLVLEIEDLGGGIWQSKGEPLTWRIEITPSAVEQDLSSHMLIGQTDLARDWWSIAGASSQEAFEAQGRDRLCQLRELGLGEASRVLEIGCGTGQLAAPLLPVLSPTGRYVGIDAAPELIAFCTARHSGANARFLCHDRPPLPFCEAEFDFITLGTVLTRLPPREVSAMLAEARRLLAPAGQILLEANVSGTVPLHAHERDMAQFNEAWLRGEFGALGLDVRELDTAPLSADCRRVTYHLALPAPAAPAPEIAPDPPRDALLVLGMHRSGTSVVTRLLTTMGAAPPHDLIPAGPDNPDGYWEPSGFVRAMDELLAASDSTWFDWRPLDAAAIVSDAMAPRRQVIAGAIDASFAGLQRAALKDPRACRAAGLIRALLDRGGIRPRAVLVLRNPAAVAASLKARDQISAVYAGVAWARHMVAAEAATRDMARIMVDYDVLLENPTAEIARIATFLPWSVDDVPGGHGAFLRPPAIGGSRDPFGPGPGAAFLELHAALAGLAQRDDGPGRAAVDAAAARVDALASALAPALQAEFAHLRASGRNLPPDMPRPETDALAFAAAMERLHGRLAGPIVASSVPRPRSRIRDILFRGEDIYAGFVADPAAVDMQGWNSDHPILGWCIATLRPRLVIEVGTWKGRSAIGMARAMEAQAVEGEVLCIDTWLGSPEHWLAEGRRLPWRQSLRLMHGYPRLYQTFLNNVAAAGLQHRITPLPLPSDAAFQVLSVQGVSAGVIYIDAGHDEDSVSRDLRLYAQVLAPNGVLVMDDYDDNWPGVRRAVDRFVSDGGFAIQTGGGKALLSRAPSLRVPPEVMAG